MAESNINLCKTRPQNHKN